MTVLIAVGTRPEVVKLAPVVRACEAAGAPYVLLHTGQHYSFELDGVFFEELGLPHPQVRLAVGSGSQAYQISTIVGRVEPILEAMRPDVALVQGDTNSVLAVALAARSLKIPVGHVEAGLRSYDRDMPEETNRVLVDHIADDCFAPTERARRTLLGEGIGADRITVTGNTVVDEVLLQRDRARSLRQPERLELMPRRYALATVHRAENTNDPDRLRGIFDGLARTGRELEMPILAALHPRTRAVLDRESIRVQEPLRIVPSMGYLEFLGLHADAALVLTDSGGLQEEACTLRVPCVTLRDTTERPESIEVGANILAGWDPDGIVRAAHAMVARPRTWTNPFGDGRAGERIVERLGYRVPTGEPGPRRVSAPDLGDGAGRRPVPAGRERERRVRGKRVRAILPR